MKRMTLFVLIAFGVLLAGSFFVYREIKRAPLMPSEYDHPAKPMDAWQAGIKPDSRTDYATDAQKRQRLKEKLRREELRQKPQEGRN